MKEVPYRPYLPNPAFANLIMGGIFNGVYLIIYQLLLVFVFAQINIYMTTKTVIVCEGVFIQS